MKKLITIILILCIYSGISQVKYPFDLEVVGDVKVDSVLWLPNKTVSAAADTILVVNGNKVYYRLLSGLTSIITDNQIVVGTGTGIEGDANFTWDASTMAIGGEAIITPNSATDGLTITQAYDQNGIYINSEATSTPALFINGKYAASFIQDVSNGYGLNVTRNIAEVGLLSLVSFKNLNATDTQSTLELQNDGSGPHITTGATNEDLEIDPSGTGKVLIAANTNITGAVRISQSGLILNGSDTIPDCDAVYDYVQTVSDTASWHNWTPTLSWTGTAPTVNNAIYRFKNDGNTVHYQIYITFTTSGIGAPSNVTISLPIAPADINNPIIPVIFLSKTGAVYAKNDYAYIDGADNTPANRLLTFGGGFSLVVETTYGWSMYGFYEISE